MKDLKKKRCNKCKEEKPLSEYYRMTHAPDGKEAQCKSCRRAQANKRHRSIREELQRFAWY